MHRGNVTAADAFDEKLPDAAACGDCERVRNRGMRAVINTCVSDCLKA